MSDCSRFSWFGFFSFVVVSSVLIRGLIVRVLVVIVMVWAALVARLSHFVHISLLHNDIEDVAIRGVDRGLSHKVSGGCRSKSEAG